MSNYLKDGWLKIENFLNKDIADLLYGYVMLAERRLKTLQDKGMENTMSNIGEFGDAQSPGDFRSYGDLIFDTVLLGKVSELEKLTGIGLIPQYTYYRMYRNGSILERHTDRESCEISCTLCLGYDADYSWPIWIKDKEGKETPVETNPGDVVVYKGSDLEHWREPFVGHNHAQAFLHYTDKEGQHNGRHFDGRLALGMQFDG